MADPMKEKVSKLHDSRAKAEAELNKIHQKLNDAIENTERRVRVDRLVTSCEEAMTKAYAKNELLLDLANKSTNPESVKPDLEKWLNDDAVKNDEILKKAREYLDNCRKADNASQTSVTPLTQKTKSSKVSSSLRSKTSSQRQKELLLAKQRREEIEKQNEAALRLTQQKQDLELKRMQQEQERLKEELALRVAEVQEENRKKLAEATLIELELQDDLSETNEEFQETLSQLSRGSHGHQSTRVNDWVNNSPTLTSATNQCAPEAPVVGSNQEPTVATQSLPIAASSSNENAVGSLPTFGTVQHTIPSQREYTTVQAPLSLATTEPLNRPINMNVGLPGQSQVLPGQTGLIATSSAAAGLLLNNTSILPHPWPSTCIASAPTIAQPRANPIVTLPMNHVLPNLSAWSFPVVKTAQHTTVTPVVPLPTSTLPTTTPANNSALSTAPVFPISSGGTVFYVQPTAMATSTVSCSEPQTSTTFPSVTAPSFVPASSFTLPQPSVNSFTMQDLAQLLSSTKKDHLPEWKLAQFNGDSLQWHEWFGQFKSAIDSSPLTDDVKLTYLKTLVTGKAKTAIAEFAYCGTMYKDALKTLERKFGQPQAVVSAYLDKLANVPPVKMHNSESIISYAATICSLVGVFRSLNYVQDLSSASLLGQAVQKLPPNLKEGWSMHTVKRDLVRPTVIDFNDWLKDKAEAHERMKASSGKPKVEETPTGNVTKTKTNSKVFAATTTSTKNTIAIKPSTQKFQVTCVVCKDKHPLWRCQVFRKKTPTERAKVVAENKLCFSCFNGQHSFRNCPQPRKCTKDGCGSTHNTLLHGAEKILPRKSESGKAGNGEATTCSVTTAIQKKDEVTSCLPSISDVKGLLQITEVELQTSENSAKVLVLCDSACSHSWISSELADKLDVRGTPTKLTVHGINSNKVVDTQMVELKLTPVHSGGSCSSFTVKPYVRDQLTIGNDVIDVDELKTRYPHLEPIALSKYSYTDVKMILGQDVFHAIRPLEYFESDRRNTPVAVRLPLGWVLSGPLPSTTGLFSTCFKAVTQKEHDCTLSDRLRSWYDIESYGAYKQVDSRSATDARATKILDETTYHDGSRYQVGKLWADDESCLPNNYFSALIQLKSLERRLQKDADLKASYTKTISDDFSKGYIVQVDKTDCFKVDQPREWYLPHHPVVHPHKPGKVRRVLNGAAKFHGQSLNSALLAGPDLLQSLILIPSISFCCICRHRRNVSPSWSYPT